MANIVYYLGAGASAGTGKRDKKEGLPCVKDFVESLNSLCNRFDNTIIPNETPRYGEYDLLSCDDWQKVKSSMLVDLFELRNNAESNATIDTYAKKLYLKGEYNKFAHMERLLVLYFIIEQCITKPDSRYDTFFANILQGEREIPEHIKIISWNYDSQIEIAFNEYDSNKKLSFGTKMDEYSQDYNFIKINGTASFLDMKKSIPEYRKSEIMKHMNDTKEHKDLQLLYDAILLYKRYVGYNDDNRFFQGNGTSLSFAFDSYHFPSNGILQRANEIIEKADALVIIGYTFPFFNREVDRRILKNLPTSCNIYIQDLNPTNTKQNLLAVLKEENSSRKIVELQSVEQFYLPPEL